MNQLIKAAMNRMCSLSFSQQLKTKMRVIKKTTYDPHFRRYMYVKLMAFLLFRNPEVIVQGASVSSILSAREVHHKAKFICI